MLVFIGLGLFDENDVSVRGLEEVKTSDYVFAEFYTSLMAGLSLEKFEEKIRRKVTIVSRRALEEENGESILRKAANAKVAFLVSGDPLIATTHVDLRIRAQKRGIRTRVVHGASIVSAAMGASGLQNYRFGRSVTVPFPEGGAASETPYNVVAENKARNLHTLCFLDVKAEKGQFMTVREALEALLSAEKKKRQNVVTLDSFAVGLARVGAGDEVVKADYVKALLSFDFGGPPHTLVFPAPKLHFVEAEALVWLAGAPEQINELVG